jgi:SPP1 family phage portal protein
MRTYQDLLALGDNESLRKDFIISAIADHKATPEYKIAKDAEMYMKTLNPTIMEYKKLLYTITGEAVPDNFSANHKCASSFFKRFVTQENQYLLGNGTSFGEEGTKERLGGEDFDLQLQKAGRAALVGGLSFGFANLDHIEVFKYTEFKPLWDEEDGSLKAGIRYWQVDDTKPLRATLYELDGYTEYIKRKDEELTILKEKRPYQQIVAKSEVDGTEILEGKNYPTFPIIPLWGNPEHQSELVTIRSQIDAYDLIKSGFANDLDDASMIYWTITNAGGMDDVDLAQFLERMKVVKAAVVGDDASGNAKAEAHTLDVPYQSREAYLTRLEADMYKDAMALDTTQIAAGQVTATQIEAAYEPLNEKCDMFEYCVIEFVNGILDVLGIEDTVTFTRSKMSNKNEEIQAVLSGAEYLSQEYITEKLLTILGDIDRVDEILEQIADESMSRMSEGEDLLEEDEEILEEDEDSGDIDSTLSELEALLGGL